LEIARYWHTCNLIERCGRKEVVVVGGNECNSAYACYIPTVEILDVESLVWRRGNDFNSGDPYRPDLDHWRISLGEHASADYLDSFVVFAGTGATESMMGSTYKNIAWLPTPNENAIYKYNINSDSFTKLDANLTFPSAVIDAKWVAGVVLTNDTIC